MKNSKKILLTFLATAILILVFNACKKNDTSLEGPKGKQKIEIYLNDDPALHLSKVLVDVRYIEVKVDTGAIHHDDEYYDEDHDGDEDHHDHDKYGKWDTLSVTPRVYDLLKLKNGSDTLIANGYANAGKISKIRITLGNNNTVWIDSTHSFPLVLCDNKPYIYVKVKSGNIQSMPGGQSRIRIDFDVAKSIDFEDNNYCFEPKLKCYSDDNTGKIEGKVTPRDARAIIKIYNNTDTAFGIPEDDGDFKVKGLKPATYNVLFKATAPYSDSLITNVKVQAGQETKLQKVVLHR